MLEIGSMGNFWVKTQRGNLFLRLGFCLCQSVVSNMVTVTLLQNSSS